MSYLAHPVPVEGRFAIVTKGWVRDAVDTGARETNA
jgi:hypothetical protein